MSDSTLDLARFRRQLEALRERLVDDARSSEQDSDVVEADQSRIGRLSRLDALQGQAMSIETRRRRKAMLEKVSRALSRIDDDEFGTCEACGEPIAAGRLEADPTAVMCVRCAERVEAEH